MKYLILVGDGMGDYPLKEHDGQTPLELAQTPYIDALCAKSALFFNQTVPAGYPPGSDVANMSLMGYDPKLYYTGRAPLEAAAMGIDLREDQYAYRCNMVTLEYREEAIIMEDFSADHISTEEARLLIADIEKTCGSDIFHFKPGVSYRNLMLLQGDHPGFATEPPHDHIGKEVTAIFERYQRHPRWKALLEQVGQLLAGHPVNRQRQQAGKKPCNMLWLWGEGKKPAMPKMAERFGISGTMISAVDLLKGLGVLGGLDAPDIARATGYIDTNYEGKAKAALDALQSQDFVFVHLEGPDEAGHKGSLADKIQAIEDFDQRIVKVILEGLRQRGDEFRAAITMDHYTPLALRTHTSDPVPTLLYDSREKESGCGLPFSEKSCTNNRAQKTGSCENGFQLVEILLEGRS